MKRGTTEWYRDMAQKIFDVRLDMFCLTNGWKANTEGYKKVVNEHAVELSNATSMSLDEANKAMHKVLIQFSKS